jgi:hypothetical protein
MISDAQVSTFKLLPKACQMIFSGPLPLAYPNGGPLQAQGCLLK